jgi:hypothetical protein
MGGKGLGSRELFACLRQECFDNGMRYGVQYYLQSKEETSGRLISSSIKIAQGNLQSLTSYHLVVIFIHVTFRKPEIHVLGGWMTVQNRPKSIGIKRS